LRPFPRIVKAGEGWPKIKIRELAKPARSAAGQRGKWGVGSRGGPGQKLQLIADWFRQEPTHTRPWRKISLRSALCPASSGVDIYVQCRFFHRQPCLHIPLSPPLLPIWPSTGNNKICHCDGTQTGRRMVRLVGRAVGGRKSGSTNSCVKQAKVQSLLVGGRTM